MLNALRRLFGAAPPSLPSAPSPQADLHALLLQPRGTPGTRPGGIVIEVAMDVGLDVLAAYPDHTMRYLNHSGRVAVLDALPDMLVPHWKAIMDAAEPVARITRAWTPQHRPAPLATGRVRMISLHSDGLRAIEGDAAALQRDRHTGPLLMAGGQAIGGIASVLQ